MRSDGVLRTENGGRGSGGVGRGLSIQNPDPNVERRMSCTVGSAGVSVSSGLVWTAATSESVRRETRTNRMGERSTPPMSSLPLKPSPCLFLHRLPTLPPRPPAYPARRHLHSINLPAAPSCCPTSSSRPPSRRSSTFSFVSLPDRPKKAGSLLTIYPQTSKRPSLIGPFGSSLEHLPSQPRLGYKYTLYWRSSPSCRRGWRKQFAA